MTDPNTSRQGLSGSLFDRLTALLGDRGLDAGSLSEGDESTAVGDAILPPPPLRSPFGDPVAIVPFDMANPDGGKDGGGGEDDDKSLPPPPTGPWGDPVPAAPPPKPIDSF